MQLERKIRMINTSINITVEDHTISQNTKRVSAGVSVQDEWKTT